MPVVIFQNEANASVKTRLMQPSNENASVNADMNIKWNIFLVLDQNFHLHTSLTGWKQLFYVLLSILFEIYIRLTPIKLR